MTAERILKLPNAARMVGEDIRSKPIQRFPFYVLYRSLEDEITIVAVAHHRRRPGTGLIAHSQLPNP